ncbi:hypothetical protein J6590_084674 [Homalodisca vitripennis]|nr:hypothetical protein J6590_084674 [Homalodisca vitripennis]
MSEVGDRGRLVVEMRSHEEPSRVKAGREDFGRQYSLVSFLNKSSKQSLPLE